MSFDGDTLPDGRGSVPVDGGGGMEDGVSSEMGRKNRLGDTLPYGRGSVPGHEGQEVNVAATGPMAGTLNDFRLLFPELAPTVQAHRPVAAPKLESRSSRRSFFRVLAPKKAKP